MSNNPHTLQEDFPHDIDRMHALKLSNPRFAELMEDYDRVNDRVHLAETNVEPMEELAEVALRKQRMAIKDEIARLMHAVAAD